MPVRRVQNDAVCFELTQRYLIDGVCQNISASISGCVECGFVVVRYYVEPCRLSPVPSPFSIWFSSTSASPYIMRELM